MRFLPLPLLTLTLTITLIQMFSPSLTSASASASPSKPPPPPTTTTTGHIKTSDGISLTYTQTGPPRGQSLLFITGWRQASVEWRKQVDYFSSAAAAGFRVTVYDIRGHGESQEPDFGYRISRFAADLNGLLTQLDLTDVTVVAHSMGCSVVWAWWDLYHHHHHHHHIGSKNGKKDRKKQRISRLVLVDQAAVMVADPHWTAEEAAGLGAIFTPGAAYDLADDMAAQLPALVKGMFTPGVSVEDYEWVLAQNRKMSDAHSATLFLDHAFRDWRDVLPRITVPTLVIGGEVSIFPAKGVEWVARQIPGAENYTFTAEEKGSHFMFWENPQRFNSVVKDFIKQT